jgi:hypothetical protein
MRGTLIFMERVATFNIGKSDFLSELQPGIWTKKEKEEIYCLVSIVILSV